ncbi:hypothetical protein [Sphingobacterium hungaricum]|uniref:Lipoprotein n=1 Tax=Sphingobacterium hungaricum TaxID=2082723 RepID=A0A928YQM8_9SPHI|nr:hypothetical protein [Sphingobacterium hungaricum]MBE8714416.1 hypothetical protein [Sphingobacterium hungaricum]
MRKLAAFPLLYSIIIPFFLVSCGNNTESVLPEPEKEEEVETEDPNAPPKTWRENWLEHELLLTRQYYNDSIALYYDEDMDEKITWPRRALTKIWNYTWKTYGGFGPDTRLRVALHGGTYGGGHPGYYLSNSHGYINIIDAGLGTNRWLDSIGEPLDLITHEVGHIVEGNSYNTLNSPAFPIWGDSKWMEIYQYDVYKGLGWTDKATSWHNRMLLVSDNFPRTGTFWYRDWFYPIYDQYGKTAVLNSFFKLISEHFPSTSIPNGRRYTRNLNFGEFVHFWSAAAGSDLKQLALDAFGENDRNGNNWVTQFEQAQVVFNKITY